MTDVVVQSEESLPETAETVVRSIRSVRFKPGRFSGRNVDVWMGVTVRMAPRSCCGLSNKQDQTKRGIESI